MKGLTIDTVVRFFKRVAVVYAIALIVAILSNVILLPASIAMSASAIPVIRFLASVAYFIHGVVFIFPYQTASPWLYYFFTGNAAEMIPLFLNIILYPIVLFLEGALVVITEVAASYARPWPYYY